MKSLVELSSPYVPTDRLHAMAAGRDLPAVQRGAVLIADISGFTPLTERLVGELGARRGGEELTRHLNAVYGALLDEIERSRGSVVGFSGDAVACWFGDDDGLVATACGLRLQALMRERASMGFTVAIKVAIASGTARRFVVGDPRLYVIDVLCGSLLERVARGETLADQGELVVGAEIVAAARDRFEIARWLDNDRYAVVTALEGAGAPTGWPAIDPQRLDEEQLRLWLLPPVHERLRSGQGEYLSELRQAVALFVRFGGLDYDGDLDVGAKLDAYIRWVQSVVAHHEGALLQVTTGDKGSYLYAVFGAPIAHEDAAAAAVEAALVLRTPPAATSITQTQIGISRGQLRTGGYGSERRRTYGALGDETNVAARLMMKAAPGQVLASERVVKGLGTRYALGSLGELALKGKQQRVPVFEITGHANAVRQRRVRERGPVIGREHERGVLHDVLDRVARGEPGHSIVLEGDPGIGKSRLVGDLLDRARALPGVTCAITAGVAIESAVPYHALRRVLERLFAIDSTFDRDQMRAAVAARMPPPLAPLAPLLGVALPLELADTSTTAELTGAMRAVQTRRVMVRLLDVLAGPGPLVLVIEDAQFLDSASWGVIEAAREQLGRLLLVLTVRPTRTPVAPLAALGARTTTHTIRIAGLSHAEVVAVVAHRLGVAHVPDDVAALVGRVAEGNPFFAEELASALRETGVLEVTGDTCHVTRSLDALPFPDTIEGVVTSRIDRLPPNELLTLKVASVLGRAFQIAPLTDVFPVIAVRDQIPHFVAALSNQELATRVEAATDTYVFKHGITQDIAYNLMLFEQRRGLHEHLADWFDTAPAGTATELALDAVRAYHRMKAIEGLVQPGELAVRRALDAVMAAGQRATATGATSEGLAYFGDARTLIARLPPSRERSTIELDLCSWRGTALAVAKGPTDDSVQLELARARVLCDELGDRTRLFDALFAQWYAHLTGSEREGALEFSQRLLDLAGDGDGVISLLAQHARGATLISIGDHVAGAARMKRALAIARTIADSSTEHANASLNPANPLAHARNPTLACHLYLTWASWFLGLPDQALAELEHGVAIATQAAHPVNLAQAECFAALTHRYRRDLDRTDVHAARAYAIGREHGFPYWTTVAIAIRAWVQLRRGDAAGAVAQLEELARRDREAGMYPLVWVIARVDLIDGLTVLGRFDDAQAVADEAKLQAPSRLLGFGLPEVHRVEAALWRARGDLARARVCLERAIAVAREQGARSLELRAELAYCRIDPARLPALARVYATFTEGLDTADLVEARELLVPVIGCDVARAAAYVHARLARELSTDLDYHCLEHTRDDVLPAALELAARAGLSAVDSALLATAVWFHDLGFVELRDGHEQVSRRIAREVLPGFGYSAAQLEIIDAIIGATKLPQAPRTLLDQLMADADLDVLGRDDFIVKNDALRRELINSGQVITLANWYEQQLGFVSQHRYFTNLANDWRGPGKQRNIVELEHRLARAKAAAEQPQP